MKWGWDGMGYDRDEAGDGDGDGSGNGDGMGWEAEVPSKLRSYFFIFFCDQPPPAPTRYLKVSKGFKA